MICRLILYTMKFFGVSKQDAEKMLLENMSATRDTYVSITKEQLYQSDMGEMLKNYDMPLEEFKTKVGYS